jgi:hypothetical protein
VRRELLVYGGGAEALQLQEAEVTRERQLRYDAPLENIPKIEAQRPKGPKAQRSRKTFRIILINSPLFTFESDQSEGLLQVAQDR